MDMKKVEAVAFGVVGDMGGAMTMAMGYVGDKLGLFRAMAGAGPLTSVALAKKTRLIERYAREWLKAMTASGYVEHDAAAGTYHMTEEQSFVLATEDSPMFVGGIKYSEMNREVPEAIARFFRPGYINFLAKDWLGTVPGLVDRLTRGGSCQRE